MTWGLVAVGGGSVVSGFMGSRAAKKAAEIQAQAQRESAAIQRAMFEKQNLQQTGYRAAGGNALADIGALGSGTYGIYDAEGNKTGTGTGSGYLTKQFTPEDFEAGMDPGYAFRLKMGQEQAQRQANQAGGTIGGNALKGLQDYTQGSASQEYGNAFNRFQTQRSNIYNTLASIAGLGQTSLGQTGAQSTQAGANIGNAIGNAGSAQAAGMVGSSNAFGNAITGAAGAYGLSQMMKPQAQSFSDTAGWSGGGSGMVNVPNQGTMSIGEYFRT
jgi:hypothetical protein